MLSVYALIPWSWLLSSLLGPMDSCVLPGCLVHCDPLWWLAFSAVHRAFPLDHKILFCGRFRSIIGPQHILWNSFRWSPLRNSSGGGVYGEASSSPEWPWCTLFLKANSWVFQGHAVALFMLLAWCDEWIEQEVTDEGLIKFSLWIFKKEFILQGSRFRFTAQLRGRYRDFLYPSCPQTCITSFIINIWHQTGTFVTTNEPTLSHHCHPKSIVHLGVQSRCCTFCGVDYSIMTCVSLYSITQSIFTVLKKSSVLSLFILSPIPQIAWQPLIFLLSPQFCLFQDVTELESYSM